MLGVYPVDVAVGRLVGRMKTLPHTEPL